MALTDNLVAYYKLDESSGNATDAVGGTSLTASASAPTAATGKISGARQFTSTSTQRFSLADNATHSTGDIDFSFSAWVYMDARNNNRGFLGKWTSGQEEYALVYLSNRLGFYVHDASSGQHGVNADDIGDPSASTWYHIVCGHDALANIAFIQVNGGTRYTVAHTTGVRNGTSPFNIGDYNNDAGTVLSGRVDEVGMWKRVLSSAEAITLYNSGAGLAYPFTTSTPLFLHAAQRAAFA